MASYRHVNRKYAALSLFCKCLKLSVFFQPYVNIVPALLNLRNVWFPKLSALNFK